MANYKPDFTNIDKDPANCLRRNLKAIARIINNLDNDNIKKEARIDPKKLNFKDFNTDRIMNNRRDSMVVNVIRNWAVYDFQLVPEDDTFQTPNLNIEGGGTVEIRGNLEID